MRLNATDRESSGGGIRTPDTRIMIQRVAIEKAGENEYSQDGAAPGAAVGIENGLVDSDLQAIIQRWADLPDAVKAGIVAMVRASSRII